MQSVDLTPFSKSVNAEAETYWDFRAPGYDEEVSGSLEAPEQKDKLVQMLFDKGVIDKNSDVLDLGCGPGHVTQAFAKRCKHVVGIDISANMLALAEKRNRKYHNVSFTKMNWAEHQMNWKQTFDLVFANMSPAVCSVQTLKKMMEASRRWCFYSTFSQRSSKIKRQLDALYGLCPVYDNVYYVFHILWSLGMQPTVWYETGTVQRKFTPKQAFDFYTNDYLGRGKEAEIERIVRCHIAEDGMVYENMRMKKGCVLWEVKKNEKETC